MFFCFVCFLDWWTIIFPKLHAPTHYLNTNGARKRKQIESFIIGELRHMTSLPIARMKDVHKTGLWINHFPMSVRLSVLYLITCEPVDTILWSLMRVLYRRSQPYWCILYYRLTWQPSKIGVTLTRYRSVPVLKYYVHQHIHIYFFNVWFCKLQSSNIYRPRDLRHETSSPARTLGSWVRIPFEAWMSVCVYSVCR
jgi:hypothetical protein